jgi:hypothetical protein
MKNIPWTQVISVLFTLNPVTEQIQNVADCRSQNNEKV